MANHAYTKGLLYKKTLNSSGEVTGTEPLLLKTLASLVIMSDGTTAEQAISSAITNMVTPDETTIVTGQDGITISVKKSTSAEIDEILGDVPTEHTWEGYYTKSEVNTLVGAVDAKFNQNDIETALGYTPIASSTKGSANGVASLDANGLVPSAQLPSYVDDVIESATFAALPSTGETGKIYVTLNDNKTYRWSGSAYVEISQSLALGETSSTAFAGDKGKIAYDHASDTTKHVPTGGTNAQYLKNTGNNTYAWASPDSSWPATPTNNTIPGNKLVDDRFKVNETNILSVQNKVGKNLLNFKAWSEAVPVNRGTKSVSDNAITLTATDNDCYTTYGSAQFPEDVRIKVDPGDVITLSWDYSAGSGQSDDTVYIFGYNETEPPLSNANVSAQTGYLQYTAPANAKFCTFRVGVATSGNSATYSNIMICNKVIYDQDSTFQPYGAPNPILTPALAEVVDKGAKNILDFANLVSLRTQHATVTKTDTTIGVTSNDTWGYQAYSLDLPAGTYELSFNATAVSISSGTMFVGIFPGDSATGTLLRVDVTSIGVNHGSFEWTGGKLNISFYANPSNYQITNSMTITDVMICSKAEYDVSSTYVPYALPNHELTKLESEDRSNMLLLERMNGAKNYIDSKVKSQTITTGGANITVTVNPDKSFEIIGTTGSSDVFIGVCEETVLPAGDYVLSGLLSSAGSGLYLYMGQGSSYAHITSGTYPIAEFSINSNQVYTVAIHLEPNKSYSTPQKIYPMISDKSAWDSGLTQYMPYALSNTDLTRMVNDLQKKAVKVYTYHVNPNESDPEDAVTYLDDATGLTPAKMGASSFSYGSWADAWFLPRPCMLKSDGTVAYYLNPNDYSKKTDGTASDIADANFDGNVMLEFPKIWVKRVNDGNGARTVSIAPVNVDGTYKCWSNINAEDKEVDHFYLPAYNGTIHSSKMRSLSGVTLDTTYAPNYTRAQEVTAATANNPSGKNMWYTETWADMCLVYDLLYLMGKSLDVQRTFGQGLAAGAETEMRAYVTGSLNDKGLFYGDISAQATGVKVLGMENLWGCRWHGIAGLINDNGALKVKMTYGVADGSTTVGYNTTGSGYLDYGSTYGTVGYVKKMQADNTMGYKIIETAGSDATYYCDYYYTNNSQLNYALLGGNAGNGAHCGFYVVVDSAPAAAYWYIGAALSCRP